MKINSLASLALAMTVAACGGNSLLPDTTTTTTTPTTEEPGITSTRVLPPGTASPTRNTVIVRREAEDLDTGSGYAKDIVYDRTADTFTVDGLAFDGDNAYTRGTAVGSLGPYAVYEGPESVPDSVTGEPIPQFLHRALYGISPTGRTEFAIVRTGSYISYGFGGFVYQRNDTVTLPAKGDAKYSGDYAAIRDFNGKSGLEYATGDMTMAIDFKDFNAGSGVAGSVTNRAVFDINGRDITSEILDALTVDDTVRPTALPSLVFSVGPGALDVNGEITGNLTSSSQNADGSLTRFENGKYYAIISGSGADQIVGVLVATTQDPRFDNVTVRETGGFILTRGAAAP